jgi:hypothetical protein
MTNKHNNETAVSLEPYARLPMLGASVFEVQGRRSKSSEKLPLGARPTQEAVVFRSQR